MNQKKFKEYEKRAYSTVYKEDEGGFHDTLIKDLSAHFLPTFGLNADSVILDIGCGPGVFIENAANLGYSNVTGVTLSQDDYNTCIDKGFKAVQCSMSDLKFSDDSVDLIWCRHALEHSPYPLFTLYEFHRVLKTQAKIFIEVPAPDNERIYMHEFNPNHYSILGTRMWQGLFEKSGFELVSSLEYAVDVDFNDKTVNEKSLIFILQKSDRDMADFFYKNYGVKILD